MIKQIVFSVLAIISVLSTFAQPDFSTIDKKSVSIPDTLLDYQDIALYLTKDLETDTQKARAIYIWIAHNIQYDLAQVNSEKRYASKQEIIDEVFKNRKGVCQHYAELFLAMSQSVGLQSYLIKGYTRDVSGEIAELSHAWNGIHIDSNDYLIDATWAAGYKLNGKYIHEFRDNYFLKTPKAFIKDHMPFDPIWQFSDNPITNQEFISQDFAKLNMHKGFAFRDSISQFETLNTLEQLETSNKRIIANGIVNKLIQKQVNENIFQITNRRYNIAVDTLNYGIDAYNLYIGRKNRRFRKPKLSDADIQALIENAENGVHTANDILNGLFSSNEQLNQLITDAKHSMPPLISNVEREKAFVKKYLKTRKLLRRFLFIQ